MDTTLRILDEVTGSQLQRCNGPAPGGSCPRVAIGDLLPCAGHALAPEGSSGQPYAVSGEATLCPVTLAVALAVASDSVLTADC